MLEGYLPWARLQPLFCLKIRGEGRKDERNTSERSCAYAKPRVSSRTGIGRPTKKSSDACATRRSPHHTPLACHAHSHSRTLTSFTFFPMDFREKEIRSVRISDLFIRSFCSLISSKIVRVRSPSQRREWRRANLGRLRTD